MRHYYHIRQSDDWGSEVTLYPKEEGKFRCPFEPLVPRICVAPTIPQCIVALGNLLNEKPIYVYKTKYEIADRDIIEPYEVPDSHITDEAWLCEPTDFVLDRVIKDHTYYTAPTAGGIIYDQLLAQEKYLKHIKDDEVLQ